MERTVLRELRSSLAGGVWGGEEVRRLYSADASAYRVVPEAVAAPAGEEDVVRAVRLARRLGTSVTVRGAGTGLVGGALNGGIVLDMRNLAHCRLEAGGGHVVVGPGVTRGRLDMVLAAHGKVFAPNPSVGPFCSVGGMLGCNASGSRSLKYGSVIDNTAGVTFIDGNARRVTLPDDAGVAGEVARMAAGGIDRSRIPRVTKNSSGYRIDRVGSPRDAHRIIVGSEGTLGIVTSARLRIMDMPRRRVLFVVGYGSAADAAAECAAIARAGSPSAIEFVDGHITRRIGHAFAPGTECLLFVEYDRRVRRGQAALEAAVTAGRIAKRAEGDAEIARWWRHRESALRHSLAAAGEGEGALPHVVEDAAVPPDRLGELFRIQEGINREFGTRSVAYGHVGDGNVHLRLISQAAGAPGGGDAARVREIASRYFEQVIGLGGTISAEHGDGLARSGFVRMQYGDRNYGTFERIKGFFDPDNVLNPGKIVAAGAREGAPRPRPGPGPGP